MAALARPMSAPVTLARPANWQAAVGENGWRGGDVKKTSGKRHGVVDKRDGPSLYSQHATALTRQRLDSARGALLLIWTGDKLLGLAAKTVWIGSGAETLPGMA
jgi:hypothetical protein